MRSSAAAFVGAMVLTALLTPLVRRAALAVGAVDEPGRGGCTRGESPAWAESPSSLDFSCRSGACWLCGTQRGPDLLRRRRSITLGLVGGSLLVLAVGLLDDIKGFGAKSKLLMQIGRGQRGIRGWHADRSGGSTPEAWERFTSASWRSRATVLWIVGIINAINLIDGLDGLAAGVAFFACLTNFAIASLTGNLYILLVTASLGGAVIGFLFYNFNPAQIFMGDSGSMFLGFVLASASLLGAGTQKSPTLIAIVVPILALGLPIMDMLMTIARRFLERRSIFTADRGHIHHRLLDMGLTHRRAVLSLYLVSIAFTIVRSLVVYCRPLVAGRRRRSLRSRRLIAVVRFVGYFGSRLNAEAHVEIRSRKLCGDRCPASCVAWPTAARRAAALAPRQIRRRERPAGDPHRESEQQATEALGLGIAAGPSRAVREKRSARSSQISDGREHR